MQQDMNAVKGGKQMMKKNKVVIEVECASDGAVDEVINEVNEVLQRHIKIDSVRYAVDGRPLSRVHLFALKGGMSYASMRESEADIRFSGMGPLVGKG